MKAIILDPVVRRQQLISDLLASRQHDVTVVDSAANLVAARQSGGHHLIFVAASVILREGLPLSQALRRLGSAGSCALLAIEDEGPSNPQVLLAAGVDDILAEPLESDAVALRISVAEHRLRRGSRRERWFETLVALGTTVYTVTDEHGIVLYTSTSLTPVAGFLPDQILGKSLFDLVVPEDRDWARKLFRDTASEPGRAERAQLRCWNADGTQNIVEASIRNCLEDPLIGGVIITSTDVTRQRETESALETSELRYRTLVETAREGIAICDADETLAFVNPAFAEMLGYDRDELKGLNLCELTDETEYERLRQATVERRSGVASRYEVRLFTKQQEPRFMSLSAAPLLSETGDFLGTLGLVTDITDQHRSAERLRKSEERYRLIAENVTDVIWTRHLPEPLELPDLTDAKTAAEFAAKVLDDLEVTYVSPSVTRMLGYSVEEAMALSIRDVLSEGSCAEIPQLITSAFLAATSGEAASQRPVTIELEYVKKDGVRCWGELTGNFLWDGQGRLAGSLVVTRDVSERKHVETALLESEVRFRRLIENMPDFVILVDEEAEIRYVNRGVGGLGPAQLVGQRGFGFLVKQHHDACQAAHHGAMATGEVQFVEARDVFGTWWRCRLVPLTDKTLALLVMIICTDITEAREANEAVRKEQDLLRQLIELHERDRKVLAFELHDGFAQQLTGAMMSLEAAARLMTSAPEKAPQPLGEATRLLAESIEESRRLVSGLRPPVLDQFGIVAAIEHLVGMNHCDEKLRIEFVSRGRARRLAAPLENAVFRIVQEALTNIRRHSGSPKALVELLFEDERVCVEVRDWGVGFEPTNVHETCFGLRGIRERARLLGGHAEIESESGAGTTVRVCLPMVEGCPEEIE